MHSFSTDLTKNYCTDRIQFWPVDNSVYICFRYLTLNLCQNIEQDLFVYNLFSLHKNK